MMNCISEITKINYKVNKKRINVTEKVFIFLLKDK